MPAVDGLLEYTIIDAQGRVLSKGTTMHLGIPLEAGQALLATIAPDNSYRAGESWVRIPERPSADHIFDYSVKAWIDPRTLEQMREEKWTQIKAARAAFIASGVDVPGLGRFDADQAAAVNVTGMYAALDAMPEGWTVAWTRFDNTTIVLTKDQFRAMALAVLAHNSNAHEISRGLRELIDQANYGDLAAIQWPA